MTVPEYRKSVLYKHLSHACGQLDWFIECQDCELSRCIRGILTTIMLETHQPTSLSREGRRYEMIQNTVALFYQLDMKKERDDESKTST